MKPDKRPVRQSETEVPCWYDLLMYPNPKGNDWCVFAFTASELGGEWIDSLDGKLRGIEEY